MEDFRGIAEESFPSFLANSLLGNSEVLGNVTLQSNFGLPIAVSTLAKNRPSTDNRCPDVQASYLIEGKLSVPSASSPGCQSESSEPRERAQLSFQGDDSATRKNNYTESTHLSHALVKQRAEEERANTASVQAQRLLGGLSPLQQVPDSALNFHLKSWTNNQDHKIAMPDAKYLEAKNPNSDFSHTSFLDNEKLLTLTNLDDSSDDDINDEEFYDDHLEAYFEQLAIPGMIYEAGGQESPENVLKFPISNSSQECGGEAVLVRRLHAVDEALRSTYHHCTNETKGGFDPADYIKQDSESPQQNKYLAPDLGTVLNVDRCLNTETPTVSIQRDGNIASSDANGDNGINSPDTLLSPTCERRACEFYESGAKTNDDTDLSQNVVYQNEDGRWVTDLAYYTSFIDQQGVQMSPNNERNEDFRSGSDALDLIASAAEVF